MAVAATLLLTIALATFFGSYFAARFLPAAKGTNVGFATSAIARGAPFRMGN